MMEIQELITKFNGVKQLKANSYQVKCPAHSDNKASLTITQVGNKILMYCHAGCKTSDILNILGLNYKDLSNRKENKNARN